MSKSKKSLTGGKAAVKSLKKEKVEHVFGLIGSATMEMLDALYHEKTIKFIGVRGFKVEKISEIYEAVKAALKCNKPAVIDVDVDPKALYSFRRDSFKHRIK